jgi:hypothetical protein
MDFFLLFLENYVFCGFKSMKYCKCAGFLYTKYFHKLQVITEVTHIYNPRHPIFLSPKPNSTLHTSAGDYTHRRRWVQALSHVSKSPMWHSDVHPIPFRASTTYPRPLCDLGNSFNCCMSLFGLCMNLVACSWASVRPVVALGIDFEYLFASLGLLLLSDCSNIHFYLVIMVTSQIWIQTSLQPHC